MSGGARYLSVSRLTEDVVEKRDYIKFYIRPKRVPKFVVLLSCIAGTAAMKVGIDLSYKLYSVR